MLALTSCAGKTVLSPPTPPPMATTVPSPVAKPNLPSEPQASPEQRPSEPRPEINGASEKTEAYPTKDELGMTMPAHPEKLLPPYQPKLGPAASLYNQGERYLQQGQLNKAEMFLERALRIEPRNPDYWHAMAEIRLHQGKKREAIQCCLKSNSLAARSSRLIDENNALIAHAQTAEPNNSSF